METTGAVQLPARGIEKGFTPLAVVILAQDEEVNLPGCLESLGGLQAKVIVVDSGSTDRTVEIATAAGATVVRHPFENYATQRNWAQAHLPGSPVWVLHLDADERLTPALVAEINALLHDQPTGVDGFLLRKRTIFMGRWIRHGGHYPSYHLRLFRPEKGRCENRLYDQHFLVDGRVHSLQHDYLDVITSDLSVWAARHTRWAALEAAEAAGPGSGSRVQSALFGNPIQRRRWWRDRLYARLPLFMRAFLYGGYRYIFRLGFLDGIEGLIFHVLQGFWFRFLADAMIYELRRQDQAVRYGQDR